MIVPLFGVGADQTARTMKAARGVIAYHLDNLYGKKKREVIAKLSALKPDDPGMFVVYASPQTMRKGGGWYELFGTLIAHKTLLLVCYDEYHMPVIGAAELAELSIRVHGTQREHFRSIG